MEDAIAHILHTALSHLDKTGSYVRFLFIDYSSAFNTIVPSRLIIKTQGLNTSLCKSRSLPSFQADPRLWEWVDTPHQPSLVTLEFPRTAFWALCCTPCTHDWVTTFDSNTVVKFADNTVVVGLIIDNNEKAKKKEIEGLTRYLLLNVWM